MLPFSSISFNFLVRRFRKSLQQSKAVRTSMSVIINRCFCSVVRDTGGLLSRYELNLVSSSTVVKHLWHHLVTGLYTTCRLYGSQNSKMSRRNALFPDALRMISSRNRAPVASPPYSVPIHTTNCRAHALEVRQLWLNLQRENIFRQHIYGYY